MVPYDDKRCGCCYNMCRLWCQLWLAGQPSQQNGWSHSWNARERKIRSIAREEGRLRQLKLSPMKMSFYDIFFQVLNPPNRNCKCMLADISIHFIHEEYTITNTIGKWSDLKYNTLFRHENFPSTLRKARSSRWKMSIKKFSSRIWTLSGSKQVANLEEENSEKSTHRVKVDKP